jgi:hypothetical protein
MNGRKREILKAIKGAGSTLALVLAPVALGAQSCAMCYQSAAASGPRTIHALNSGILILMFPPALITVGIFYLGYKKRNTFNEAE